MKTEGRKSELTMLNKSLNMYPAAESHNNLKVSFISNYSTVLRFYSSSRNAVYELDTILILHLIL